MKLFIYYRNAVLYASLLLLVFVASYTIVENFNGSKSSITTPIISASIYFLLLCVLSLTIFLNKIKKLRRNKIWNIFTWFLLPFIYIIMIWVNDLQNRIHFEFEFGKGFVYLLIMTLPFVIALVWTFIAYRKTISHENK